MCIKQCHLLCSKIYNFVSSKSVAKYIYDCKMCISYLQDKNLFPHNLLSISASPEVVIVPIVSSILIFPIVAFIVICCLRKRAARARQKARMAKRWVISLLVMCTTYSRCLSLQIKQANIIIIRNEILFLYIESHLNYIWWNRFKWNMKMI